MNIGVTPARDGLISFTESYGLSGRITTLAQIS